MHSFKANWCRTVIVSHKRTPRNLSLSTSVSVQNNFNESKDTIVIPNRIERGPTDILKALSSTIKRDPLAPHYKYHDDPFTIPVSNMDKRSFALAQESGRKAAQWIREQHSDLFQHKVADPPIEIFSPKLIYNEEEPVSPDFLTKLISNASVTDAIKTYQKLEKDNVEVSDDLKQSLLELVCYYNSEDTLPDDLFEERWFTATKFVAPKHNVWKDNDFAETLFRSFPEVGLPQYASIIQGMLKHNQVERALTLFDEAKSKGFVLPVDVYNLVIGKVNFAKEGFEQRLEMIMSLLSEMNQARITPNVETLNEILKQLSFMATFRESKKVALKTLSEMRKFGIKPSLASFNHLLYLFCRDRGPTSGILYTILDELESRVQSGESFEARDLRDNQFFSGAMEIARRHLGDVSCAYRVDKLLHHANNYNFIGDASRESAYYRNFFYLIMEREPFDTFMELYDRLVPNVYSPEKNIMLELIKAADLNGKVESLPRIWSELDSLEHWQQEDILSLFLETLAKNLFAASPELKKQLADVAWSVYTKVESHNEIFSDKRSRATGLEWTGTTLGHLMTALLGDARLTEVDTIFSRLLKEDFAGVPEFGALESYFNAMVEQKNLAKSMRILQFVSDLGFSDLKSFADKLEAAFTLTPSEHARVLSFVGNTSKPNKKPQENQEEDT